MVGQIPQLRVLTTLEAQASDDATFILKLPKSGALFDLYIHARATNGSTSAQGVSIFDVVDLIEVVGNGSQVLFSMTPEEIEKLREIRDGVGLAIDQDEQADAVQSGNFPIYFGRWSYDREMWLPLARFNDLELKIRFSPTISATVGFATGTTSFNVQALWSPNDPSSYLGTIVTRTIETLTSAASGVHTVDYHLQNMLRSTMIFAYEAAVADGTDITNVEVRVNDGEKSLVNEAWLRLIEWNYLRYGHDISHFITAFRADNDTILTRLGDIKNVFLHGRVSSSAAADTFNKYEIDVITGDQLTLGAFTADITAGAETFLAESDDAAIDVAVHGRGSGYAVLVPFDYSDDPNDWLNTNSLTRLQTLLTQGGAGADTRISVEEVQRFG